MSVVTQRLREVSVPVDTDYFGVFLTNRCFLSCFYCITNFNHPFINKKIFKELEPEEWIEGLNRLSLPEGIPLTLQGGEPFVYKGIWEILDNIRHKVDILTALPPQVTLDRFKELKNLAWNHRGAPYPTIRVSFHSGQNDYQDLILRIKELQGIVSIGLYHIEHPAYPELTNQIRSFASQQGVEFRTKPFLGYWNKRFYGDYKYPDACAGRVNGKPVLCRNTVFPIAPDGTIYRCHSDLYTQREQGVVGHLLDEELILRLKYRYCSYYGTCIPCDIKVKTNHLEQSGYTSVDILFRE